MFYGEKNNSFSTSTSNTQIKVTGWKTLSTGQIKFRVNETTAQLRLATDESTPIKSTFEAFGGYTIPQEYRPWGQVMTVPYSSSNTVIIIAVQTNGQIMRRNLASTTVYQGLYAQLEWKY